MVKQKPHYLFMAIFSSCLKCVAVQSNLHIHVGALIKQQLDHVRMKLPGSNVQGGPFVDPFPHPSVIRNRKIDFRTPLEKRLCNLLVTKESGYLKSISHVSAKQHHGRVASLRSPLVRLLRQSGVLHREGSDV
jgi:hypothetical protein